MRCNYPRRRPKAPVKGGDEHRLSMDYIRCMRPCIMHIMDMVAERYKVGEDLCNDPATGRFQSYAVIQTASAMTHNDYILCMM